MMNYWERETPIKAATRRNNIEYYPIAGKLSVARPAWVDENGEERRGKTVTVDIAALKESPDAVEIFKSIAAEL